MARSNATALDLSERRKAMPRPLLFSIFSSAEEEFVSQPHVWLEGIDALCAATPGGVFVIDREADNGRFLARLTRNKRHFVIRVMTGNNSRNVRLDGIEKPLRVRDAWKRGQAHGILTCERLADDGTRKPYTADYSSLRVRVPGIAPQLWLCSFDSSDHEQPLVLLTDQPANTAEQTAHVLTQYFARWSAEEMHRFAKQAFKLENIRLLTWKRIRNMVAILWIALGALCTLGHGPRAERVLRVLEASGGRVRQPLLPGQFWGYTLVEGLRAHRPTNSARTTSPTESSPRERPSSSPYSKPEHRVRVSSPTIEHRAPSTETRTRAGHSHRASPRRPRPRRASGVRPVLPLFHGRLASPMSILRPPRWPLALALAALALHLLGGLAWIAWDRLVFDGDESGHVGAAELFMAWWGEGRPLTAIRQTFAGRLGSYPPLYAGVVGAWWALTRIGDPASPWVRGLNLLWPLLAAGAVARLAWPLGARARAVGFAAVLGLPLLCGLGRHFMIEGALVAAVAGVVLLGEAARARPTPGRFVAVGLGLGLAFLVKQTALIYLLPVLALRLPRRPLALVVPLVGAVVAAPWLLANLEDQVGYTAQSAAGTPGLGLLRHLTFYPWSLFWVGAGPALLALAGLGVAWGWQTLDEPTRDRTRMAALWLGASLLILLFVPRKYPRLMAPALPAVGLLCAVAVAEVRVGWRRWAAPALLVLGLLWTGAGSLWAVPLPANARVVDDRCPQIWLRPAVHDDLGMGAVLAAARRAPPGPVRILGDKDIPCALQTTHPWREHVGPALRRAGLDREILEDEEEGRAALVLSWEGPVEGYRGHAVVVEGLGASVWIGARGR